MISSHQSKQKQVIVKIEQGIKVRALNFSTVTPVKDYEKDTRICLTSVHLPHQGLLQHIHKSLIKPLRKIEPDFYCYSADSLHMTIKNVRVINDPPHFNQSDAKKAKKVFSRIVPQHKQFEVYFYRLLLFPNNLALIGTTESELDNLVLDLDSELKKINLLDDKVYANSKYFFCNMTLARFGTQPSSSFKNKAQELSEALKFKLYLVDSVTLLTCNAVFKKRNKLGTWQLQKGSS